ncbi:MAG: hypothetical protein HOP08_16010 [Cyclobacteriaceae bacterium]|nr:hypothetical protein [Cyclobacteriaceae bacterium]
MRKRYAFVLLFILSNCADQEPVRLLEKSISDPYYSSFYDKQIKLLIKRTQSNTYDTTRFDVRGNIVETRSIFGFEKIEYDGNHFATRYQSYNDLLEHYQISYDTNLNILIQKWSAVKKFDLDRNVVDVDQKRSFFAVFIFDNRNVLLKEINLRNSYIDSYGYEGKLLVKRTRFDLVTESLMKNWSYYYEGGVIKKIEERYNGGGENLLDHVLYFNNGRLDSAKILSDKGTVTETEFFDYEYY